MAEVILYPCCYLASLGSNRVPMIVTDPDLNSANLHLKLLAQDTPLYGSLYRC